MINLKASTEIQEQIALFKIAASNRITDNYLIANNHGDELGPHKAAMLSRRGLKAGTPDLFLAYPVDPYVGLWVELKRRYPTKGKVSEPQKVMMQKLRNVGYAVHVAWGWQEAWDIIIDYINRRDI